MLSAALAAAFQLALATQPAVPRDPAAGTRGDRPVNAVRLPAAVVVDGRLDDAVYALHDSITGFTQRDPVPGAPASQHTAVWVFYDDANLYVGARMHDTAPDSVRALLARRDRWVPADRFFVFVDGYRDKRTGFYFGVNAAGTQYDGTLFNDEWDDDTWDGVWIAKAQRTADGWTAEFRIPLSQLRFAGGQQQEWGVNFRRDIARLNERDFVVYQPPDGSGFVSRFPSLQGITGLQPRARREILPYVTSRFASLSHAPGDPFRSGTQVDPGAGVDAKLGLGNNLTLDATVNPDFGQVEVDPAVVNLSDVEVFFQERRPFFIEGQNIFNFGVGGSNNYWGFAWSGIDFLYTRRIGRAPQGGTEAAPYTDRPAGTRILGAGKLSGRVGSWNLGVLGSVTRREYAALSDGTDQWRQEVEPLAFYGVARTQKEFNGGRQGLGFIGTATARDFEDPALASQVNSSAYVGGLDGWTFLDRDRTWVIAGWAGASRVAGTVERMTALQQSSVHYFQRPDATHLGVDPQATSLGGYAGRLSLNRQKGNWTFNAAAGAISPGFEVNDLGFQGRADLLNAHVVTGYRWVKPTDWYQRIQFNVAHFRQWDFGGNRTFNGIWGNTFFQAKNFWAFGAFVERGFEAYDARLTRGGPLALRPPQFNFGGWFESDDRRRVVFGADAWRNTASQGANDSWGGGAFVEVRPTASLTVRVGPSLELINSGRQYLQSSADTLATATYGRRYLFGDLDQRTLSGNFRVNWIFTPRLSLELFAQPFFSSGQYTAIKELAAPKSFDFLVYGTEGSTVDREAGVVDPDGAGPAAPIAIGQPDFSFVSLRGNAVLRWEYIPGSTLFLVWNHNRAAFENRGDLNVGESWQSLRAAPSDNILALKITYWWNP